MSAYVTNTLLTALLHVDIIIIGHNHTIIYLINWIVKAAILFVNI